MQHAWLQASSNAATFPYGTAITSSCNWSEGFAGLVEAATAAFGGGGVSGSVHTRHWQCRCGQPAARYDVAAVLQLSAGEAAWTSAAAGHVCASGRLCINQNSRGWVWTQRGCCREHWSATAMSHISNHFLLADVAAAVVQLQLTPCAEWVSWFRQASLPVMQQLGGQGMLDSWFLAATIGLAAHLQTCQQQSLGHRAQVQLADDSWHCAWIAAESPGPTHFSSSQLSWITAAASQLDRQLPGVLQAQHLADITSSSCVGDAVVAAAQNRHVPDRLWVLQVLQELCQLQQQVAGLMVAQHWLAAAASLLPNSVMQAASALAPAVDTAAGHAGSDAAGWRSADGDVHDASAKAQLQLVADALDCLVRLEWRGASDQWCRHV